MLLILFISLSVKGDPEERLPTQVLPGALAGTFNSSGEHNRNHSRGQCKCGGWKGYSPMLPCVANDMNRREIFPSLTSIYIYVLLLATF